MNVLSDCHIKRLPHNVVFRRDNCGRDMYKRARKLLVGYRTYGVPRTAMAKHTHGFLACVTLLGRTFPTAIDNNNRQHFARARVLLIKTVSLNYYSLFPFPRVISSYVHVSKVCSDCTLNGIHYTYCICYVYCIYSSSSSTSPLSFSPSPSCSRSSSFGVLYRMELAAMVQWLACGRRALRE